MSWVDSHFWLSSLAHDIIFKSVECGMVTRGRSKSVNHCWSNLIWWFSVKLLNHEEESQWWRIIWKTLASMKYQIQPNYTYAGTKQASTSWRQLKTRWGFQCWLNIFNKRRSETDKSLTRQSLISLSDVSDMCDPCPQVPCNLPFPNE